jgi:hypothetical protein
MVNPRLGVEYETSLGVTDEAAVKPAPSLAEVSTSGAHEAS